MYFCFVLYTTQGYICDGGFSPRLLSAIQFMTIDDAIKFACMFFKFNEYVRCFIQSYHVNGDDFEFCANIGEISEGGDFHGNC